VRDKLLEASPNDAEPSSPRRFCADCIIAMPGYDFREGQWAISEYPMRDQQ
jgi:hypothetical protein